MSDQLLTAPAPLRLQLRHYEHVALTLVGCGGTGSHLASGIASLAQALGEHGQAVSLRFIDPDRVEPKNVGRQLFSGGDIGQPKAAVLASRLNAAYGLAIGAGVRAIDARDTFVHARYDSLNLVIGAVDNPGARGRIAAAVEKAGTRLWWLDCGNENHSGQVALGNCSAPSHLRGAVSLGMVDRLPCPLFVYPDLVVAPAARTPVGNRGQANGRAPSCAELTAAGEQGLMVNRMAAAWALTLLHDFLLGELRWFALAFDLMWGGVKSYTLDLPTLSEVTGLAPTALEVKD